MGRSSPFSESTCDPSTIVFPTSRGSVISPSSVISITALALLIELRFLLPQTSKRDKTKLRTANLDPKIHILDFLSGQERSDLQAFLNSLTGELPPDVGPPEAAKTQVSKRE